jgi:hypothetical protein
MLLNGGGGGGMSVWWRWVGVGLLLPLAQPQLLPLLLQMKDVNGVL